MDITVLAYIKKDDCYLMLLRNKKQNDMNEGKWLGIGGHVEENETPDQALIREVKEETNLDVISYTYRGLLTFINNDYQEIMHLYTVEKFSGELKECDEGTLKYQKIKDIPNLNIWEGDKVFLVLIAKDVPFFKLTLIYENDKLKEVKKSC